MAQKPGFAGKKFVVKTNIINGIQMPVNSLDIEIALSRKITFNANIHLVRFTRSNKGIKKSTGDIQPRNSTGRYKEYSKLKSGTTEGWMMEAGFRFYFNSIVPAPYGWYYSTSVGYGTLDFKNYEVNYSYEENAGRDDGHLIYRPAKTNLNGKAAVFSIEFPSFGYQRVFKKILIVDGKISGINQYCNLPDNLINAFEPNYYIRGNILGYGIGNYNVGLSFYLKIGVVF